MSLQHSDFLRNTFPLLCAQCKPEITENLLQPLPNYYKEFWLHGKDSISIELILF